MEPSEDSGERAKQAAQVATAIRLSGAGLMLFGPIAAFDLGGMSSAIGVADGVTEKILGAVLFVAGVVDYFVIPQILKKRT